MKKKTEKNRLTRAYRSKIGGLPFKIREELNRRIMDGSTGIELVKWLNGLPEWKAIRLKKESSDINSQNLTDWRNAGYRDWLEDKSGKNPAPCQSCAKKDADVKWFKDALILALERIPKAR